MSQTPIYKLGYFVPNMLVGDNLDLDKNRFLTIESQLYNLYNIFGNGILSYQDDFGTNIQSWLITTVPNERRIEISPGRGHINFKFTETVSPVSIDLVVPPGVTSGAFIFYIYATETLTTPVDKSVSFITSLTEINDPINFVGLGAVVLTINSSDGSYTIQVYNTAEYGRKEISLFDSLSNLVKKHVHDGESAPLIDLSKHVTGLLDQANVGDLDLSKVTQGTLDPNRLPQIDHNDLKNIGTLTHDQIDSIINSLESLDDEYKISELGIINRLIIILALKRQPGYFNVDGSQINSVFYAPYIQLDNFVDYNNTTAIVSNDLHRVIGVSGITRQSNVASLDSVTDFETALFYAQETVSTPVISNVEVFGDLTDSSAGTLNIPVSITGYNTALYIASYRDSYINGFNTSGAFVNRRKNFDVFLDNKNPFSVKYDSVNSYLYIADTMNHRVIVSDANLSSVVAKVGRNNGSGLSGSGGGTGFNYPKSSFGVGNTFYVIDSGNNEIQKFRWISGNPIFNNSYRLSNSSIRNIFENLNDPRGGLSTFYNGNHFLFVSDYNNHRILCGVETNNTYNIYQVLGNNSAGIGIFNTLLLSYVPFSNNIGVGASFTFTANNSGLITNIGVAASGSGYQSGDQFNLYYNGQLIGDFVALTNGTGSIGTVYTRYGFSSNNSFAFNHPSGIALTSTGDYFKLFISDTDNHRIVVYEAPLFVGAGNTQYVFQYRNSFGQFGAGLPTSSLIEFNRPTDIHLNASAQNLYITDSLNNRVIGLGTNFLLYSSGFNTSVFGSADSAYKNGGLILSKPIAYSSFASPTTPGQAASGWQVGEFITQNAQFQGDVVDRYRYILFDSKILTQQDTIAVAIATLNENSSRTLGQISCYLIFDDNFNGGTKVDFNLSTSLRKFINISNTHVLRNQDSLVSEINTFVNINIFTAQPNPSIIGFGFKWSTSTGWNNDVNSQINWYLPQFKSSTLNANYPLVSTYRSQNGLNDSIFAFNANRFANTGVYVYRFDAGFGGNTSFDEIIINYTHNSSSFGNSNLSFSYRTGDTIEELNLNQNRTTFTPLSGASNSINVTARFFDLIVIFSASPVDLLASSVIDSISLYYSVFGSNQGIIYDTISINPSPGIYPRINWNSGTLSNIEFIEVNNANADQYGITIQDTSDIGKYKYLSSDSLNLDNENTSSSIVNNSSLPFSPIQLFNLEEQGLNSPQSYFLKSSGGYYIADTDNDRLLEIDSNGDFIRSIQGNVKLTYTDRAFVVLGSYYNTDLKHLYIVFSQYFITSVDYSQNVSVFINNQEYKLNNTAFFSQNITGPYRVNSNNRSSLFYAQVTNLMHTMLISGSPVLKINNNPTSPPFQVPDTLRSDGNEPESYEIVYSNDEFTEFVFNQNLGFGTLLDNSPNIITVLDKTTFGDADATTTELWSAWSGEETGEFYNTSYTLPINVGQYYFDNIFKPIFVDVSDNDKILLSTVGNYSVRCYDNNFNSIFKLDNSVCAFNEKLGGSAYFIDRTVDSTQNSLLIAQPGLSTNNFTGKLFVYNRNSKFVSNEYTFNNLDIVRAKVEDDDYVFIASDRIGGTRSRITKIDTSGNVNFNKAGFLNRPLSVNISDNNKYYITDATGKLGTIFFRVFPSDGDNNTSSSNNSGGNISGGNAGGSIIGSGGNSSSGGNNLIGGGL